MWAAAAARPKGGDPPPASSLVSPTEKVAVLDANALIAAGGGLRSYTTALADRAVTIKEVLAEVRDPVSRAALAAATCAGALAITVMEPSAISLAEVTRFARATGELHSLSVVDLKVLALAHTLEVAAHGPTAHLRPSPAPPRLHSKAAAAVGGKGALPGWGAAGGDWAALDALADAEVAAAKAAMAGSAGADAAGAEASSTSSGGEGGGGEGEEGAGAGGEVGAADAGGGWEVAAKSNAAARRRKRAGARRVAAQEAAAAEEESEEGGEDAAAGAAAAAAVVVDDAAPPAPLPSPAAPPPPAPAPAEPSRIVCVTGDFAMQNVALQLGLRLAAPDGRTVCAARRWALRCSACGATSREAGRLFCPACGHAALDKVEVLAGPGGAAVYGVRKRHTLRGTIFPIPLPRGGKGARSRDPVLAEDAMPGFGRAPRPPGKGRNAKSSVVAALDGDDAATAGAGDADAWFARSGVAPPAAAAGAVGGASAVRKLRGPAAALAGWRINPNERVHQRTNRRG